MDKAKTTRVSLARASCDAVPSISVRLNGRYSSRDSGGVRGLTTKLLQKVGDCTGGCVRMTPLDDL